jgi:hypothetical protein
MCIACAEFIKDKLTFKEYQSALWEMTREDEEHLLQLERIFWQARGDQEKIREQLRDASR